MKRLTERDEYGNADIIALSDVMPEIYATLSFSEANALTEALNRLADYEDSGVLPDKLAEAGHWFDIGSLSCRCSECGCKNNKESNYCPECGAYMKGESNDQTTSN